MKGKHKIVVKNNRLHYEFEIKRNITIIKGDSATGKTLALSTSNATSGDMYGLLPWEKAFSASVLTAKSRTIRCKAMQIMTRR